MTKQLLLRQHSRLLSLVAEIEFLLLSRASEAILAEHVKIHRAYQYHLFKSCSKLAEAHTNFAPELLTVWWEKHTQEVDSLYLED